MSSTTRVGMTKVARAVATASAGPGLSDTQVTVLDNGVRVVTIRMPHLESVCVSVFVRTGSRDESPRLSGISHFIEHMAFKGTRERDSHRINLDAERLGADVNAHTDKDHTAFHMRGLARHAESFVRMLGDIVLNATFPADQIEAERQVLLQEFIEDEEDPLATAFKLFDRACYGLHPLAQPVIGTRRNIERFSRADLADYVSRHYTGANIIVGVAGPIDDSDAIVAVAEQSFSALDRGTQRIVAPPPWHGGYRSRRLSGSSQSHAVIGFPIASAAQDDPAASVAAALFGEGMSSPLMREIRERLGLVYYAACSADVSDASGQFVIEASTTPDHLDAFFTETSRLLAAQAKRIDPVDLERALNQITMRTVRAYERPFQRLEDAAQDLFVHGRIRPRAEVDARLQAVTAADLRRVFDSMQASRAAVALAGRIGHRFSERVQQLFGG